MGVFLELKRNHHYRLNTDESSISKKEIENVPIQRTPLRINFFSLNHLVVARNIFLVPNFIYFV